MLRTYKKSMACAMLLSLTLTGCGKSLDVNMTYSDTIEKENLLSTSINSDIKEDFLSSDLCLVPIGKDKGDDSKITGASSLIFDVSDRKVIYADNIYERIYPASLTKLLTALVVFQNANLDDVVTVSYNASHITEAGAKLCGLQEGDKIVLGDLLTSLLVYSGNDAGIALAEHISGSEEEFAKLMNKTAKSIGAVDTHFVNAHGLHDENHYTTAYDLYLIFNELLNYDQFLEIIHHSSYTLNYIDKNSNDRQLIFPSTNKYLNGEVKSPEGTEVLGGKTGTTNAAGYCLEILVKDNNGKEYIALVMKANGADDLYRQLNELISKING